MEHKQHKNTQKNQLHNTGRNYEPTHCTISIVLLYLWNRIHCTIEMYSMSKRGKAFGTLEHRMFGNKRLLFGTPMFATERNSTFKLCVNPNYYWAILSLANGISGTGVKRCVCVCVSVCVCVVQVHCSQSIWLVAQMTKLGDIRCESICPQFHFFLWLVLNLVNNGHQI